MFRRIELFFDYLRSFCKYVLQIRELMGILLLLIVFGGCIISYVENMPIGDAIYFACITALSIGYGDITPETAVGKVLSVAIGVVGLVFVGLTVAIATHALSDTAKQHQK